MRIEYGKWTPIEGWSHELINALLSLQQNGSGNEMDSVDKPIYLQVTLKILCWRRGRRGHRH